jgi:drug/metabolite transporter (DMT)-like permease
MGFDKKVTGHLLLIVVVLTWGVNFGILKLAFHDIPPLLFAALRFTISGILLLAVVCCPERKLGIRRQDLAGMAVVGGLGIGLYQVLWSTGLDLTTATNSALILAMQPLLAALFVGITRKEALRRRQVWSMLLAFGGVVLIILKPTAGLQFSIATLQGDLLTLIAAICATLFFSFSSKPLLSIYSPLRLMAYGMIIGSVVLWTAIPFLSPPVSLDRIGPVA